MRQQLELYSLLLPAAILIILFSYIPMWGVVIAFQDYLAGNSLFALDSSVQWVGLKHFKAFIGSINFNRVLFNTLRLSLLNLAFGFTLPIIFALVLNEVRNLRFKKFVQTASYLPYFISMVVVAGMLLSFLELERVNQQRSRSVRAKPKEYIAFPQYYPAIYTITNVWKSFGFGSILYFSTISSIDPTLYESAKMDGANRWQQMVHITFPSILFIIAIPTHPAGGANSEHQYGSCTVALSSFDV